MSQHANHVAAPASSPKGAQNKPVCPLCGEPVSRVSRGPLGRLFSLLLPMRRYRWESPTCHWQGYLLRRARREVDSASEP